MRILHTSDWHIGRTFHGADLLADQRAALAELAAIAGRESVDVVIVAGDIYDRAIPSADAVAVCDEAFCALREAGARIVVSSGNHDSPTRLGAGATFSAEGGLYLRTRPQDCARPVLLSDAHGPVCLYALPYLEPETTRDALGVPEARSHQEILAAALSAVRVDLDRRRAEDSRTRAVVAVHAFVVGAAASGSERSIAVGGVETVSADLLMDFDYVALGHLHSTQEVRPGIWYSGSPLAYSFGERSSDKGALLVELDAGGLGAVTRVPLRSARGTSLLTGTIEQLLTDPAHRAAEEHYVSAILTDPVRPVDPMRRLKERFPYAVHLEWIEQQQAASRSYKERVVGRSDIDVMAGFLADVRSPVEPGEVELLERALRSATSDGDDTAVSGTVEVGRTA